jgi:hypothetical protein
MQVFFLDGDDEGSSKKINAFFFLKCTGIRLIVFNEDVELGMNLRKDCKAKNSYHKSRYHKPRSVHT